ncbi:MAG: putative DNA binding domain-containing protein, partial [Bacteroidales bacterium]|nr:putative DNA binding domain-containing protein [Bacteroidales bacterium]
MRKEELIKKLQDIEWEDFEVKEAKSAVPKSSWESVSAFSNTAGGWLIFGVAKKGKGYEILGVSNAEKIEQDFVGVLRGQKFNRKINVRCKKYSFGERVVLGFYIPQRNPKERPIYFNSQYNTFIRVSSGDQRATREEIDAMHRNSSFEEKDDELCEFGIEGVDNDTLESYRNYFKSVNPGHHYLKLSDRELLEKLRVLDGDMLTMGGLLVFGKEDYILKKIPSFKIDYLEIDGISYRDAENRYRSRVCCEYNLFNCFFSIYDKLIKNVEVPFRLKGGFRDDDPSQVQAIREALVNLLIHSDYYSSGTFRIRVFEDRIEFFNNGGLPKDLDFILKRDFSQPRSPIVAKIFRYLRLSEGLGTG